MFNEVQPEIQGCGGGPRKRAPTKSFSNNNGIYTMHSQVSCIYSSLLSLLPLQDRSQKHQLAFWGAATSARSKSERWGGCLCACWLQEDTPLSVLQGPRGRHFTGSLHIHQLCTGTIQGQVLNNLKAAARNKSLTGLAGCSRKLTSDSHLSSKSHRSTTTLAETKFS